MKNLQEQNLKQDSYYRITWSPLVANPLKLTIYKLIKQVLYLR